jgi:hypothetical protein
MPAPPPPARASIVDLVLAWLSAACVPVALLLGRAASIAFLSSRGYSTDESEPPGLGMVSFLILIAIVLVPVAASVWFGTRAARGGRPVGAVPAILAALAGGVLLALGLPLFLSGLVGWPVALLVDALLFGAIITALVLVGRRRPEPTVPTAEP